MMTKDDYMRLPKERLAELLVERDNMQQHLLAVPMLQCYQPGGVCTNPFHDCINCPRQSSVVWTNTSDKVEEQQ